MFESRVHVELQFARSRLLCSHHELKDDMKRAAVFADSMLSENKTVIEIQLTAQCRSVILKLQHCISSTFLPFIDRHR
jgi:hypothetical protein